MIEGWQVSEAGHLFVHMYKAVLSYLWLRQAKDGEKNAREGRLGSQGLVHEGAESWRELLAPQDIHLGFDFLSCTRP